MAAADSADCRDSRSASAWQGSPTFKGDQFRSIPLAEFAPLAKVPGVTLVSLQKRAGEEQIAANRDPVPVTVFPDLDVAAPFVDTAAVMQHLDLVITSDTAIAHLAGALGRPVWVAARGWIAIGGGGSTGPIRRGIRRCGCSGRRTFHDWPGVFARDGDEISRSGRRQ